MRLVIVKKIGRIESESAYRAIAFPVILLDTKKKKDTVTHAHIRHC